MKQEHQLLWDKIKAFEIDEPHTEFRFEQRLARENGWTAQYARRVIEEYKKFIFMCCISPNGVTPSDEVDQAWHLHLTYTKSYWVNLCRHTLKKEIHHHPTKGGANEKEKFNDFYTGTLSIYALNFGVDAPADIWPAQEKRFAIRKFERVNRNDYWVFPKLVWNAKAIVFASLIPAVWLLVQATDQAAYMPFIFLVIFGVIVFLVYRNLDKKTNSGDGDCSSACSSDDDGHHGHHGHHDHGGRDHGHSGCSSDGCSGCGSD
ncbi:hypothetical protein [Pedobacter frigidisoli]|uniref:glycine-rich domain-containing protein n=1 Tax=Pedobacter frigidisoli TaxID=2530455 RepID=UPI002931353E|nr:hypothetical protein [Pedobacter frigidisoli]